MDLMIHAKLRKPEKMSNEEFFGMWKQEAAAALAAVEAGAIKSIWKVPGKYEVILVIAAETVDDIDVIIHSLPIWQLGYDYLIDLEWTLLRPYENWAQQLEDLAGE